MLSIVPWPVQCEQLNHIALVLCCLQVPKPITPVLCGSHRTAEQGQADSNFPGYLLLLLTVFDLNTSSAVGSCTWWCHWRRASRIVLESRLLRPLSSYRWSCGWSRSVLRCGATQGHCQLLWLHATGEWCQCIIREDGRIGCREKKHSTIWRVPHWGTSTPWTTGAPK